MFTLFFVASLNIDFALVGKTSAGLKRTWGIKSRLQTSNSCGNLI